MPPVKTSRPQQRSQLQTGTLLDADPAKVSRHLSDLATALERIQKECDLFSADLPGFVPASGGGTTTYLRADGTWTTVSATVAQFTSIASGVVPASGGGSVNFLRADGSWAIPAGSGETNTASNQGTLGVGVFDAKVGVDLQFRDVAPGSSKVTTTLDGSKNILVDVVPGNFTGIPESAVTNLTTDLGNKADLVGGVLKSTEFPTLTGDVTTSGLATTIAANAVTNAKAAQMAANSIKGNNTAGLANAVDLTVAQTKALLAITEGDVANLTTDLAGKVPTSRLISTTAPLAGGGDLSADRTLSVATFGTGASGVVPASGGANNNFLRDDGTWTVPADIGRNDPGSQTIADAQFLMQYRRLTLTGSERMTMAGTGQVFLDDFDAYTEAWQTASSGQTYIGQPYSPQTDVVLPQGYFFVQFQRLQIEKTRRLSLQGQPTSFVITDFTAPTGRLVLQGHF